MRTLTYKAIQNWVKETLGFVPKPCWIAHMMEILGLPLRVTGLELTAARILALKTESRQFSLHSFTLA